VQFGVSEFIVSFCVEFMRRFRQGLESEFSSVFGRVFQEAFGHTFRAKIWHSPEGGPERGDPFALAQQIGVDVSMEDWEDRVSAALSREELIPGLLESESFWRYMVLFHSMAVDSSSECRSMAINIYNPFSVPLLLAGVLAGIALEMSFTLGRHLSAGLAEGDVLQDVVQEWLQRYPAEGFVSGFAWEELAGVFASSEKELSGPSGCLFLSHAAFGSLMTGVPCGGPVWQSLLAHRDREDPLIEASYCMYEICHFRNEAENARRLLELSLKAGGDGQLIFRAAGFA